MKIRHTAHNLCPVHNVAQSSLGAYFQSTDNTFFVSFVLTKSFFKRFHKVTIATKPEKHHGFKPIHF